MRSGALGQSIQEGCYVVRAATQKVCMRVQRVISVLFYFDASVFA